MIGHIKSITIADGTNTDIGRPSDWNSAHNQFFTLTGNTAGVSAVSGTNIVLAGGSNITLSASQGTDPIATLSFIAPTQSAFVFSNSNGVSFGTNGSTVTATVQTNYLTTAMASNRGSDFVQATAAFAGTNASGTIASNGVSVSVAAQSVQPVAASAANGSYAFSTLSFSNANGVSFGTSAGSAITASHNAITTARASTDAIGLNSGLTANGVSMTANSSGLSLNFPAFLTRQHSPITATATRRSP